MITNLEEISSIKRKLTVEIDEETAAKAKEKIVGVLVKKSAIKGFRQGKAPKSLVLKLYADHIKQQMAEDLIEENLEKALAEHKLDPVGRPVLEDVTAEDGQSFKFELSMEVRPEFEVSKWEGLELTKEKAQVAESQIDKRLEQLQRDLSTVVPVEEDRQLIKGDIATIQYGAFDGEEAVAPLKSDKMPVELGAARFFPEVEEGLAGLKKGESKDISVAMPASYHNKDVAGKTLTFKVTVLELRTRELPTLDDELAKDVGLEGVENMAGLRDWLREDFRKAMEGNAENKMINQMTEKLNELVDFEVPEALVERETLGMIQGLRMNLAQSGLDFGKMSLNEKKLAEDYQPKAQANVKSALILNKIADDNKIEITPEDVKAELEIMSQKYGQSPEAIKEYYLKNDAMDELEGRLRMQKTVELVKSKAKITMVDPAPEASAPGAQG